MSDNEDIRDVASSPISAIPPQTARVSAFASVLLGGLCGAVLGFSIADFECRGSCQSWHGLGLLGGALIGSLGLAVVAVVTLRAMGEWSTLRD